MTVELLTLKPVATSPDHENVFNDCQFLFFTPQVNNLQ